jgi:AAA domain
MNGSPVSAPTRPEPVPPGRRLRAVEETSGRAHQPAPGPPSVPAPERRLEPVGPAHAGDAASDAVLRQVRLTPAALIALRPTYWMWDGRIPHGALVLGPGREGIGKSLFCAWLAAQITLGRLPGVHHGTHRSVIYAATEDSWERTIAGRLLVAGADLERVYRVEVEQVGTAVPLSLPRDCAALAEQITAHDVALLILDPLISAVDSRINVNQEELRGALEPLAALADHTGASIFGLAHFNKATGTDALSRITGSRAFAAVARAALAFARDPHADDGSCVLSQVKNNLGRLDLPSLRYTVESVTVDTSEGPGQWGRLQFIGETETHVEALLNDTDNGEDRTERDAAAGWLEDYLTINPKSPSVDVKKAGRVAGFSERTLQRARVALKVITTEEGFPRRTFWDLP